MTIWTSDALGGIEDDVQIRLNGEGTLYLIESYDIRQAFFTSAPNVWALRLGLAAGVSQILPMARPRTKVELYVGNVLQQTGWTDGLEADSDANSGSSVSVHGRDRMAELHDAHATGDHFFKNVSFGDLTDKVLTLALGVGNYDLIIDGGNRANRMASTSSGAPPPTADPDIAPALTAAQGKELRIKYGEKYFDFLQRELIRGGLFLITGAAGEFILCVPNTTQPPLYRIVREAGATRKNVSVVKARYRNTSTTRYTRYEVRGKGGGGTSSAVDIPADAPEDVKKALIGSGAAGQKRQGGVFIDSEMVGWGYSEARAWTHKDPHATSRKQMEMLARKKCADDRRTNWQLIYTMSGHTVPKIGSGKRLCWAIDTMVQVVDDEFGLNDNYWIESVNPRRDGNGTTTDVHLMRPEDLVFGDPTA